MVKWYTCYEEIEHIVTTKSNAVRRLLKFLDKNIKEKYWNINEAYCLCELSHTKSSIKHLVWDYSQKKQALLEMQCSGTPNMHVL